VRGCSNGDVLDVARILGGGSTEWYCNRDDRRTRAAVGGVVELAAHGTTSKKLGRRMEARATVVGNGSSPDHEI
jgi:hypothetical protein